MRGLGDIFESQMQNMIFTAGSGGASRGALTRPVREGRRLISELESSYEGHTVDALVPTGDEGRDKLR